MVLRLNRELSNFFLRSLLPCATSLIILGFVAQGLTKETEAKRRTIHERSYIAQENHENQLLLHEIKETVATPNIEFKMKVVSDEGSDFRAGHEEK
jgi:hypothetical protein